MATRRPGPIGSASTIFGGTATTVEPTPTRAPVFGPIGAIVGHPGANQPGVIGAPARATTPPAVDPSQLNAQALLANLLHSLGLDSLVSQAQQWIAGGFNQDYVLQQLRQTNAWKTRYAAILQRQQNGLPPISEGDVLSYESAARQLMQQAGLPSGFYDQPQDFVNFIGRDVSVDELRSRVQDGYAAAMAAPTETRAELERLYGIGPGGLAAYFLDPQKALPIIQRQFAASQIGGAAERSTYGLLTRDEAERLAALGVTDTQAQQGFGDLATSHELFTPLPGEQGATIGRQQQLGAAFGGDAASQAAIAAAVARRKAAFAGDSGFRASQAGVVGLGTAQT